MRLFKFGKVTTRFSGDFEKEYFNVKYVQDPDEQKARSDYVYSILYDVSEWDLENLPTYIDVEFKAKISKEFKKKKESGK